MNKLLAILTLLIFSVAAIGIGITDHSHEGMNPSDLPIVDDHSGRTNAQGCHNNRKTGGYHCH